MFHHSDRCKLNETIYLFSTQDGTLLPLLWIWITRLKSLIISILSFSAGQTRYKISMFVFERYVRNCIIISGTKGRTSVKIKTWKHIKSSPNFVQQEVCIKVSFTELNVSMKVIQGGKSMTQIMAHYVDFSVYNTQEAASEYLWLCFTAFHVLFLEDPIKFMLVESQQENQVLSYLLLKPIEASYALVNGIFYHN